MRFTYLPLLALLFTSCANEGTVVRKDSNPMPFYHSLGIDGSYKLALRDSAGAVHSQLVTPEVYQDYAEGDYFNDAQPPATSSTNSTDVKDTIALRTAPTQRVAANKLGNGKRLAGSGTGTGTRRGSSTVATRKSSTNHHLVASTPKTAPAAPPIAQPAIPVVAAHFSVGVQPSAPIQTTAIIAEVPAVTRPVVTNKIVVAQKPSVQKASTTRVATAPASRRSHHVAAGNRTSSPAGQVASTNAKQTPSSHVAFVTQKVATEPTASVAPSATAKAKTTAHPTSKTSKSKQQAKHAAPKN
jgi:hypothetical protein